VEFLFTDSAARRRPPEFERVSDPLRAWLHGRLLTTDPHIDAHASEQAEFILGESVGAEEMLHRGHKIPFGTTDIACQRPWFVQ
jgi:hypothetical protein